MRQTFLSGILSIVTITGILATSGCKKDENTTPPTVNTGTHGQLNVRIANVVGSEAVTFGDTPYVNAAGNRYGISALKYYMSHFSLIKADNSVLNSGNHELIDAADSTSCKFTIDSIPNGIYTKVRFYLGVDSGSNRTAVNGGDLDLSNGMHWGWSTGYIFFKHEGYFVDNANTPQWIIYHLGTDNALATIDVPITAFEVKGNNHTLSLKFDLNRMYASPSLINFNGNNVRQSTDFADFGWIRNMKDNAPSAFLFDKIK